MLAVVYNIFPHPIPNRNPYGIQPVTLRLGDIALSDPCGPMTLKCRVRSGLSKVRDAVEFGVLSSATHAAPCVFGQPGLKDEEGAQIHSSNLAGTREPSFGVVSSGVEEAGTIISGNDFVNTWKSCAGEGSKGKER